MCSSTGTRPIAMRGGGVHAEKLLDAQGDVGRVAGLVDHPGGAAVGKREALGGVFLDELLLGGAEPAFHHGLYGLVLEVLAAEGAVADLLDQVMAVVVTDGGQRKFRAP